MMGALVGETWVVTAWLALFRGEIRQLMGCLNPAWAD